MDTFQAKVSDIRVGDLVNNNWIVSGIDTDNDNGFIRYIISYTHTDTGEEWTNDYLPNDVVTYRHYKMSAQELYQQWLARVSDLDISEFPELLTLIREISELNKITQQAEKEITK
jgi:hypothetical protein